MIIILCDGCGDIIVEIPGPVPGNDELADAWVAHKREHADLEELLAG